jgi:hypothetical protein
VSAPPPERAARDHQAEYANAEFTGWAEAQGIDPLGMDYAEYGADGMRDAFAAGMQAQRDLAAAQEPHAAPELAEPVTVAGVAYRDYPSLAAAMQAEIDRERTTRLHRTGERDEARSDLVRMGHLADEVLDAFKGSLARVTAWRERADAITGRHAAKAATAEPKPAPELAAAMDAIEKVVQSHERVMYAAAIDIRHGQPGEARRLLGERLDGWDGPQWDGTETGAQYLDRTREGA